MPKPGVPGVLADQLTLFQPGWGADYANNNTLAPPNFSTSRHPCNVVIERKTDPYNANSHEIFSLPKRKKKVKGKKKMMDVFAQPLMQGQRNV